MSIYVWGIGCGAAELIRQGLALERIQAFVDSYPSGDTFLGKPVLLPRQLEPSRFQLLIVTTRHTQAVAQQCRELGIPEEKLLFLKNYGVLSDRNAGCAAAQTLLGREFLSRLLPRQRILSTPDFLSSPALPEKELDNDYVRLSTLELLCRRLPSVPGAAAELGVYQGFFARCLNILLPERPLYLFDSFQGFSPEDAPDAAFQAAHANTTIARVLARLPHPEMARLYPGFFPDSLNGLEETFCLVSVDVDFPAATLAGLSYFWPRLSPGGYLLLHDWANPSLPGVAEALRQYESRLGHSLPSVPLCDTGGTLVLCK